MTFGKKIVVAAFAVLMAADAFTTWLFSRSGISEGNPLLNNSLRRPIMWRVIATHAIIVLLFGRIIKSRGTRIWPYVAVCVAFTCVILWNMAAMKL